MASKNLIKYERDCYIWRCCKRVTMILFLFLTAMVLVTGCGQKEEEVQIEELSKETVNVGNDGVTAAIAGDEDDVTLVSQQKPETDTMVAMSVEETGRANPFLPPYDVGVIIPKSSVPGGYDLLPPPETITVDTTATEVMTTKVSGIMYDSYNSSAILNIEGSDYLVRTGDVINNYKVLSIAKNYVTVQHGANIYKAGVGELFTGDGINYNTVSNLGNKFGGRKK